jgi:O-antigen/teichoic acid export membrane protein
MWFKEFDISQKQGRSNERYRRAALTVLSSGLTKSVSILTSLISVPLTLTYLGTERYGLWMTINSVILMMNFADLGIGNGLMNAISEVHGKDDREAASQYVSSGFFLMLAIAGFILAVFALIYPFISWSRVFNVSSAIASREAGPAMAAFVVCFAVNIPLGIVQRVQMGYQEGFNNNLWQGLGSIFGLLGVLLVIYLKAGLVWLVLAMAGGPALAQLLNGLVLFRRQRPWLRPQRKGASWKSAKKLLRIGLLFFLLQIAVALSYSSDNLVAAHVLGPEAVAQYSIPSRMFNYILLFMGMVLFPLWPAYTEAITRGDTHWVKKTFLKSMLWSLLLVSLPSIFFTIFGVQILHLWVGPEITPSFSLLLGLGLWTILGSVGTAVGMLFNAANILRFQIVCASLMSIGALLAKILLSHTIGLSGIIWGTIIAHSLFFWLPCVFYIPKLLSRMQARPLGAAFEVLP